MLTATMQAILNAEEKARLTWPKDLPGKRKAALERKLSTRPPRSEALDVQDILIDAGNASVPLRIIAPKKRSSSSMLLYIHGGAFIAGSIDESAPAAEQLALLTGSTVVSIGYRLAPEYPFPCGVEDCTAALKWLSASSATLQGDRSDICVVGISAGANLAVGAILGAGVPIRAAAFVYGLFGTNMETVSYQRFGTGEFGLTTAHLESAFDLYFSHGTNRCHPQATPLNADLKGFPPTCLIAAQCDPLLDDSAQLHAKLIDADVSSCFHEFKGMAHGFINHFDVLPEADSALRCIAEHFQTARIHPPSYNPTAGALQLR
jgi:acetyl esterase